MGNLTRLWAARGKEARRVEVRELEDAGGGAAGGFKGALAEFGGAALGGRCSGVCRGFGGGVVEDIRERGDGLGCKPRGEEPSAGGGERVELLEPVGDFGTGDPEREGFEGGGVLGGDFVERERGIGELGKDFVRGGVGGVEGEGSGHVWRMYSMNGWLSIGFWLGRREIPEVI